MSLHDSICAHTAAPRAQGQTGVSVLHPKGIHAPCADLERNVMVRLGPVRKTNPPHESRVIPASGRPLLDEPGRLPVEDTDGQGYHATYNIDDAISHQLVWRPTPFLGQGRTH